ncbi:MAG: acyl carrier protein [Bryobacteraceae bacterium]
MSSSKVGQSRVVSDLAVSVRTFILKQFPLARQHQIKDSDPLLESGILDSLGVLEVVAFIEQEYSIHVSDDDLVLENFRSIDRIAAFILSRMKI